MVLRRAGSIQAMPAMARVVGVVDGGVARAFPYASLARSGHPTVVPGAPDRGVLGRNGALATEHVAISDGRDCGSSGVFKPAARGRTLHFDVAGSTIRDRETGSDWSLDGVALAGASKGAELPEVPIVDAFWFAWAAAFEKATTRLVRTNQDDDVRLGL